MRTLAEIILAVTCAPLVLKIVIKNTLINFRGQKIAMRKTARIGLTFDVKKNPAIAFKWARIARCTRTTVAIFS